MIEQDSVQSVLDSRHKPAIRYTHNQINNRIDQKVNVGRKALPLVSFFSFCLVFLFISCASVKADSEYVNPSNESSVTVLAQTTETLRLYFMSGEGMIIDDTNASEKWGDSCLVVFPNGQTMLIDTGMEKYTSVLVANLKRMGITLLDFVIISHPHDDHIGGLLADDGILENFPVGMVYYNGVYPSTNQYMQEFSERLDAHSVQSAILSESDTFEIDNVRVDCLSPSKEIVGNRYSGTEAINNTSLVIKLTYKNISALFPGDLYAVKERELVHQIPELLDVDILKIPHHGNTTSSCREFVEAVSPQIAVSTGGVVMSTKVYWSYTQTKSRVLFDYLDGYISVVTDGDTINFLTSRVRNTDYYAVFDYHPMDD